MISQFVNYLRSLRKPKEDIKMFDVPVPLLSPSKTPKQETPQSFPRGTEMYIFYHPNGHSGFCMNPYAQEYLKKGYRIFLINADEVFGFNTW